MIEFPYTNLSDAVFAHAAQRPQAPALACGDDILTLAELATTLGRAATWLAEQGVHPGDRVGLALPNNADRVILSLAAMRLGAVVVELPPGLDVRTLAARATSFTLAAVAVEVQTPVLPGTRLLRIGPNWRARLPAQEAPRYAGDSAALHTITLSSGSTGQPKGIIVTHRQRMLRAAAYLEALSNAWGPEHPATLLLLAPAATSLLTQFLAIQILLGGLTVLIPPQSELRILAPEMAAWKNAICPMPPGLMQRFLGMPDAPRPMFPLMRALITSGQPMGKRQKREVMATLCPHLFDIYGASGAGIIAVAGPGVVASRGETVGRPAPGAELQIVTPDGQPVPAGVAGALRLRGPRVSTGFCNAEDNLRGPEHFEDGWYYPGEVASVDHDGLLTLHGRAADVIRLAARSLYPGEVEDALTTHPRIAEAAVVGCPGPHGDDEPVAFIAGRGGLRHEEVVAHCRALLPPDARPKRVYYVSALPRTGNGKIDRPALKAQAAGPEVVA